MCATHVFVYGTLKRGQPNHHWLMSLAREHGSARLVAGARTVRPFPLVVAPPYNIPYCLDRPGHGRRLLGEVYAVDDDKLRHLDVLEAYPTHYNRRQEAVTLLDSSPDAEPLMAWIYLREKYSQVLLTLPLLANYTDDAAHWYVPKERRTTPATTD